MYSQLYFDNNATTACDKRVVEAMLPYFNQDFGNPSSSHHPYGWMAKNAIEDAGNLIASTLKISEKDIIYTSGATESINMILKGVCHQRSKDGNHIITSKAEHKAVLDTCQVLESEGFEITYLDVDEHGQIDADIFKKALRKETILAAIMYANNETGVVQPLKEIGALTEANNILLFSDTTQALGKVSLDEIFEVVDFACFSAHKVYGPKGVGMVYIRDNENSSNVSSFIQGGGQQRGMRGGTLNTPGIVGLSKAIALSYENFEEETQRIQNLRDQLENGLLQIELAVSNGTISERLPNTANISFKYVDGDTLLRSLSHRIAVSNGSACNSAAVAPSHVLTAMGIESSLAQASLRFSLGRYTTQNDVEQAIEIVSDEIGKQRMNNILWERR